MKRLLALWISLLLCLTGSLLFAAVAEAGVPESSLLRRPSRPAARGITRACYQRAGLWRCTVTVITQTKRKPTCVCRRKASRGLVQFWCSCSTHRRGR